MFERHVFVASKVPDPWEVHLLVSRLVNGATGDLKVERNGRVVGVVLPEAFTTLAEKESFDSVAFTGRRIEPVAPWACSPDDVATVSVHLCATVHRRAPDGKLSKVSPFDPPNRFKPALRAHFLDYLERRTGLKGLTGRASEVAVEVGSLPADETRRRKVWMNGEARMVLRARIGDADTFGRLAGAAIGNRRSYGFGGVQLDDLET